jgi:phosphate transport system protein
MEHTVKQFDNELEHLRAEVLKMGGLVEEQINSALSAFIEGDLELASQVEINDHKVNSMEVNIDEEVSSVIARRQPAAGDLRMLMMVVKTITDLERIGDEATKIARMTKLIQKEDYSIKLPRTEEIRHMSNMSVGMLRTALDAFARLDLGATGDVLREDEKVDDSFRGVLRQLITFMMEDPRTISSAIETLFIAKAIERIGDHAKNISEYVVYMVNGKDVRHLAPEEKEQVALG